ncbi:hypothetical protein T05_3569 [Trichinella murrelli]|uniref:Uncharacterized protein n=1 Tax=Trichinella murrelli TaxID=144512 RepID=A0A0V0U108_9BILA|nr:hypothetical protein T05_3569 [Trichinella murrelli]
MKAEILHFQTCLDRLISLEQVSGIAEPVLPRYHCCYGVEPHKRKQPCTESADPLYRYMHTRV